MPPKNYYSPSLKGFLHSDVNTTIPKDAIEITDDYKQQLLSGQSNLKSIVIGEGGYPVLQDITETTVQVERRERDWRDKELIRADIELYKLQDSDTKASGSVGGWRSYRKNLRAWPEDKKFPNKEFRPSAPDAEQGVV